MSGTPANWHYNAGGTPRGPFSDEEMRSFLLTGTIRSDTSVWSSRTMGWVAASQTDLYRSLFPPQPASPPQAAGLTPLQRALQPLMRPSVAADRPAPQAGRLPAPGAPPQTSPPPPAAGAPPGQHGPAPQTRSDREAGDGSRQRHPGPSPRPVEVRIGGDRFTILSSRTPLYNTRGHGRVLAVWCLFQAAAQSLYAVLGVLVLGVRDPMQRLEFAGWIEVFTFLDWLVPLSVVWLAMFFTVWTYRSVSTQWAVEGRSVYSPTWSFLGPLVPVFNLWAPLRVVRSISRMNGAGSQKGLTLAWWISFCVAKLIYAFVNNRMRGGDLSGAAVLDLIGTPFAAASYIALAVIIFRFQHVPGVSRVTVTGS